MEDESTRNSGYCCSCSSDCGKLRREPRSEVEKTVAPAAKSWGAIKHHISYAYQALDLSDFACGAGPDTLSQKGNTWYGGEPESVA